MLEKKLPEDKIIDPISFPNKKKPKNGRVKIKNNSFRGNSHFVQMAVMNVNNGKKEFPNQYACEDESLTISVELITGYGESEMDLLTFMAKKNHNIINDPKYGVSKTTKYKAMSPLNVELQTH